MFVNDEMKVSSLPFSFLPHVSNASPLSTRLFFFELFYSTLAHLLFYFFAVPFFFRTLRELRSISSLLFIRSAIRSSCKVPSRLKLSHNWCENANGEPSWDVLSHFLPISSDGVIRKLRYRGLSSEFYSHFDSCQIFSSSQNLDRLSG